MSVPKLYRNAEGYSDPTAFLAISNIRKENRKKMKQEKEHLLDVRGVQRGDIYYVQTETSNSPKLMLVVSDCTVRNDGYVIMVPLILEDRNPCEMHCEVFTKLPAVALCDQLRTIPEKYLGDYLRSCTENEIAAVNHCLALAQGLPEPRPFEIPNDALRSSLGEALSKNEELRKENAELEKRIESYEESVAHYKVRITELTAALQKADEEVSNMEDDKLPFQKAFDEAIAFLQEENEDLKCQVANMRDFELEKEFYKRQYNGLIDKLLAR